MDSRVSESVERPEIFKRAQEILDSLTDADKALSYELKVHLDDYKRVLKAFELDEKQGVAL